MKYALIGCGRIAVNHIKAVVNNGLELTALCDIDPEQIGRLVEKTKFTGNPERYTDYRKMLAEHPDIELAAIATESGCHAEIAFFCIDRGVNVIIEKPMALSMADADEIVKRASEKGVTVSVCHQNRFNPAVRELRQAIEGGRFGKISHGSINVRWNRGREYYDQADWRGKWASDGGCLFNQCIHGIDLLRWLMGDEVDEVYGVTKRQIHDYIECEDLGMAVVKFKNGAVGTIEGTVNVYPKNLEETLFVFGEKGSVKLGGQATNNIELWNFADEYEKDKENQCLNEAAPNVYGNGHTALYADVIEAVTKHRRPLVDAVAGRNAVEMILAVYLSSATGRPVKLPLKECASTDFIGEFDKLENK
ncbi:Gfo/Idh/MocA family oxidoreductase [bacterium]|nr:Gfo/Idh/MocA family oxidoreductase [bacterium]